MFFKSKSKSKEEVYQIKKSDFEEMKLDYKRLQFENNYLKSRKAITDLEDKNVELSNLVALQSKEIEKLIKEKTASNKLLETEKCTLSLVLNKLQNTLDFCETSAMRYELTKTLKSDRFVSLLDLKV